MAIKRKQEVLGRHSSLDESDSDFSLPPRRIKCGPLSLKRTGRTTRNSLDASLHAETRSRNPPTTTRHGRGDDAGSSRFTTKQTELEAELANLADFNKVPELRLHTRSPKLNNYNAFSDPESSDDEALTICRRTRKQSQMHTRCRSRGSQIAKLKPKAPAPKKRVGQKRARDEVSQLKLWRDWLSDDGDSSNDSADGGLPRLHGRHYPPKTLGVQNVPWSDLPGEIRNSIYEYAAAIEDELVVTVVHYPGGMQRRSVRGLESDTNFARSYWGLTQTCKQLRKEFMPWLLQRRHIRTPLGTLDSYIGTFHRPGEDGRRIGWIEPICSGAPLPGDGVDVLKLLQLSHSDPGFHLTLYGQLENGFMEAQADLDFSPDFSDDLKIIRDMDETFSTWSGRLLETAGIKGISLTSLVDNTRNTEYDEEEEENDERTHEILIKFKVGNPTSGVSALQKQCDHINAFIFRASLSHHVGLKLQAATNTYKAIWCVRREGVVDMQIKYLHDLARRAPTYRRLTISYKSYHGPPGYTEESLD